MVKTLIQCVVVLYKQRLNEARSLTSLAEMYRMDPRLGETIRVLVRDNSPEAQESRVLSELPGGEYEHCPSNPGLAAAYNKGLELAIARGAEWLLLLDQDTTLHREYLAELASAVESAVAELTSVFVPRLMNKGEILSPRMERAPSSAVPVELKGFASERIMAFNSASCFKVAALDSVGGFPKKYWLDYLDHIMFYRINAAGGRIFVLDSQLEHSFSMLNMEREMPIERYRNVLDAEWQFVRDTGWGGSSMRHRLRLLKRAARHALSLSRLTYAKHTLGAAMRWTITV